MSDRLATKRPIHATVHATAHLVPHVSSHRRATAVSLLGLALLAGAGGVAAADDTFVVRVPLDRTASGAPGTTVLLDQVSVEPGLVGRLCDASYEGDNNGSVHPDTDLIITSGSTTVVLDDVEASPGRITNSVGALTLGPTVQVSVRLGADGFASLGALLTIACPTPATTTTLAPTSTAVPSSGPDTSVAVGPPPVPTQPLPSVSDVSESTTSTTVVGAAGPAATSTTAVASAGPTPSTPTATTPTATTVAGGPSTPTAGAGDSLPTTGSDPGNTVAAALLTLLTGVLLWRIRLPRPADRPL